MRQRERAIPYRLFALSNVGSMLALVSFPLLIEPRLTSRQQAYVWSIAYGVFVVLCVVVAWRGRAAVIQEPPLTLVAPASDPRPRASAMVMWVALAACASTLLISVTTHMSQDIAPMPLLWVLPLALYLATFIIAFESDVLYQRWIVTPLLAVALVAMPFYLWGGTTTKKLIAVYAAGLFICCMFCHGELARRRPTPRYLTLFYLMVAAGGAVGGIFVALLAPHIFRTNLELPIGLVACAVLAVIALWEFDPQDVGEWPLRVMLIIATGVLAAYLVHAELDNRAGYRLIVRNFYGVLRVADDAPSVGPDRERTLYNGKIVHGSQLLDSNRRYEPTDYYGPNSGVGRAIRALQAEGPVRIGSIGLGAGVLTAYGRAEDVYRIYDINPIVPVIATTEFSFYTHLSSDKQIFLGDARLTLERQASQQFDLLSVDAFTGDAIPVHLLTDEALALYFTHLKPHGVLAVHISNRYLDLAPICARGAQVLGKAAMVVDDDPSKGKSYYSASTWVLLTDDPERFKGPTFQGATVFPATAPAGFRGWTDDFSNVLASLKLK